MSKPVRIERRMKTQEQEFFNNIFLEGLVKNG